MKTVWLVIWGDNVAVFSTRNKALETIATDCKHRNIPYALHEDNGTWGIVCTWVDGKVEDIIYQEADVDAGFVKWLKP